MNVLIQTCGIATEKFQIDVKTKLDEWFGGDEKYDILLIWYRDECAMATCKTSTPRYGRNEIVIYWLRLFEIGGIMNISQDHKEEV